MEGRPRGRLFSMKNAALEYYDEVVCPALKEAEEQPLSKHRVLGLIAIVDAFSAYVFEALKEEEPNTISAQKDDSGYRNYLAKRSLDFRLFRDLAKAQKHVVLKHGKPEVTTASQLESKTLGYGQGAFGEGPYSGSEQFVLVGNDGHIRNVIALSKQVMEILIIELKVDISSQP